MAEQVTETIHGEGYAVGSLDGMGTGPGFRKVRRALDVEALPLEGKFGGQQVREAMKGHILAEASLAGVYSLNQSISL